MNMNEDYRLICEIWNESQWDCAKFISRLEKIDCKDKALILLKMGSSQIKQDKKMAVLMRTGLSMLEEQKEELDISDMFMCAIGYEKLQDFEKALMYYENCIERLPQSAMYWAVIGMKYRVCSKIKCKIEEIALAEFDLSIEAFACAEKIEKKSWRKEKWKDAKEEMIHQKERKLKQVTDD